MQDQSERPEGDKIVVHSGTAELSARRANKKIKTQKNKTTKTQKKQNKDKIR